MSHICYSATVIVHYLLYLLYVHTQGCGLEYST